MTDTLSHGVSPKPDNSDNQTPEARSEQKIRGRAIVTYGRSLMSLVIARSLSERGIEVIGCDDVDLTVLSFSKHTKDSFTHPHFEREPEAALNAFEEAIRKYAPEDDRPYVLIPGFRDAKLFSRNRDRFEPLIKIAAPPAECIDLIHPKDNFAEFATDNALQAPETRILTPDEFRDLSIEEMNLPRIVKPVDGVGGRGVSLLKDDSDVTHYRDDLKGKQNLLLQEAIDGEDYCVAIAARRGDLIAISAYKNIKQFPVESGAGAIRETVSAEPFEETARKLVAASGWHGVAEVDFRWDENSDQPAKLIEINPRFWAGLFHSTESGIDYPWLAFAIAAGLPLKDEQLEDDHVGFRSRTPAAWILSVAQEIAGSDEHMESASSAWKSLKADASKGDVLQALRHFPEALSQSALSAGTIKKLRAELKRHEELPSEFTADHDPATGLGILFALSSLVRHGELPPELKFDADEPEEPTFHENNDDVRPVIGITRPDKGDFFAFQAMKLAVWMAGGRPVAITSSAPRDPHSIDGLLFGGGSDVYPDRYQGKPKEHVRYDLARDEMEASWAQAAFGHGIPMLGVCRGMQMMNVYAGGTLHPDLSAYDEEYPTDFLQRVFYRKPVEVRTSSKLYQMVERDELCVNSIHTQAIDDLGKGFHATALEPNGLIQGIEHADHKFAVGIQFHPEFLLYRRFARDIFRAFVNAAGAFAEKRNSEVATS